MNTKCFYQSDTCLTKMSREHVISTTVLKVVFGNPIRNIVKAEFLGNKRLLDHEHTVKDVCVDCNNALSTYDTAGANLAKELENFYDPTGNCISFTHEILGWIIKTHLNHMRIIKDRETGEIYPIDHDIKASLIRNAPLPHEKFILLYEAWEGVPYFWDADDPRRVNYFGYRSIRFRRQRTVLSDFRIKTFVTWLILPSDADYIDFPARVESTLHEVSDDLGFDLEPINIGGTLESGVLNLKKILPLQEVKKFIVKQ